jgi:hypothetical protein
MKITRISLFVSLAMLSLFFAPTAGAKKDDAPGILKKVPLTMTTPVVVVSSNSVVVSWLTNKEAAITIAIGPDPVPFGGDPIAIYDAVHATEHQVVVGPLGGNTNYKYNIMCFDEYGYTVLASGNFYVP